MFAASTESSWLRVCVLVVLKGGDPISTEACVALEIVCKGVDSFGTAADEPALSAEGLDWFELEGYTFFLTDLTTACAQRSRCRLSAMTMMYKRYWKCKQTAVRLVFW